MDLEINKIPYAPNDEDTDMTGHLYLHPRSEFETRFFIVRWFVRFFLYFHILIRMVTSCIPRAKRVVQYHNVEPGVIGTWDETSSALYVMLHGFKGNSAAFYSHVREILQLDPKAGFYIPDLENASGNRVAEVVVERIQAYLVANPRNKVCILTFSMASYMAVLIDLRLRQQIVQPPLMISSVGGIFYGTRWIDFLLTFNIHMNMPEDSQAFAYGNSASRSLLDQWRNPQGLNKDRRFSFYITMDDEMALPPESGAPYLGLGETVHVRYALSHQELFDQTCKEQTLECVKWVTGSEFF